MKVKPNQIYVILGVLALFVCVWLFSHFGKDGEGNLNKKSIIKSGHAADVMFAADFLHRNSIDHSDPFIGSDFLDKKLLQLVSLTHSTSESIVTNGSLNFNDTDFSYILDELMTCIKTKIFFSHLLGCKEAEMIKVENTLYETKNYLVYSGSLVNDQVILEVANVDVELLMSAKCGSSDSDNSQQNLDRCFLLKNRKIFDETVLLMHLSHPNIAKMLGLCVHRTKLNENKGKILSNGAILIKESGTSAHIEKLKMFSWEDRLKVCIELLNLALYFTDTPLGNVRLENWASVNFIYNRNSKMIKLSNLDQLVYIHEPTCYSDKDCYVDGINCGVKCKENRCDGYNAKKNLYDLNQYFVSPLLRYNVPQKLSEKVLDILMELNNLKLSADEALSAFKPLIPQMTDKSEEQQQRVADNPAVLSMRKLPDGSQVDSWELHEDKVAINEVSFEAEQEKKQEEANKPPSPDVQAERPISIQPRLAENTDGFQKIENADYPGRYDYRCPKSKAEWGCVMSLHTPEEAMQICAEDEKCKAFVTIPHLRKEGWIICVFKSDNSNPVDHAGTTVYVRCGGAANDVIKEIPPVGAQEIKEKGVCLRDVINSQEKSRSANEARLMKACGWNGRSDEDWRVFLEESKVVNANTFKPARGKLANGGQMSITLDNDTTSYRAFFLSKQGPDEFSVSQLAVYQLDRMLGLYKTVPVIERLLSSEELTDARFPVDVGGNQFDKFRPLKQSDGSLLGVIVPQINERITVQHYISVPRLSGITNAVTPFNKRQWDDLEYLLLGFLTSIPVPQKGHQSLQGILLHLKTDEAFLHSTNDYISYLYNCQFPVNVIATLRHSETNHCLLDKEIRTRLIDDSSPSISEVLKSNIKQLLELVDKCVARFGENAVLYDSYSQSLVG